jgi:hypothetical protein
VRLAAEDVLGAVADHDRAAGTDALAGARVTHERRLAVIAIAQLRPVDVAEVIEQRVVPNSL